MRLATWNVNSALARLPRLLPWLDDRAPDVVCLQETKLSDGAFDEAFGAPLAERGYAVAHVGEGRWNGVAILSRAGLDDVERALPDAPSFGGAVEARAVTATCGGLRVTSVYVPNGRSPDDPHYAYRLEWLAALRASVRDPAATGGRPSACSATGTTAPGASTRTSWSPHPPPRPRCPTAPDRSAGIDGRGVRGPVDPADVDLAMAVVTAAGDVLTARPGPWSRGADLA